MVCERRGRRVGGTFAGDTPAATLQAGQSVVLCGRVARASRVLAIASSPSRTFPRVSTFTVCRNQNEVGFGETPKPTCETRALPGLFGEAA